MAWQYFNDELRWKCAVDAITCFRGALSAAAAAGRNVLCLQRTSAPCPVTGEAPPCVPQLPAACSAVAHASLFNVIVYAWWLAFVVTCAGGFAPRRGHGKRVECAQALWDCRPGWLTAERQSNRNETHASRRAGSKVGG